jgi:hypothetical protein
MHLKKTVIFNTRYKKFEAVKVHIEGTQPFP